MKSPSKLFLRKNKKNQSLLADVDASKTSYYEVMDDVAINSFPSMTNEVDLDSRDEIYTEDQGQPSSPALYDSRKGVSSDYETVESTDREMRGIQFSANGLVQRGDWGDKPVESERKLKNNKKQEEFQVFETQNNVNLPLISSSSEGDDIFDDLESVLEEVAENDNFMNDLLANKSSELLSNQANLQSISRSVSSMPEFNLTEENKLNKMYSLMSSKQMNSSSKGILIVDPSRNGAVYHMDEDNKSLTDKDLIIMGYRERSHGKIDEDLDDTTVMSSLTEVTYQKSHDERTKLILKHLQDRAATIPESNSFFCGMFECLKSDNTVDIGEDHEDFDEEIIKNKIAATEKPFSFTEDTGALMRTLFGGKVEYGSFNEKVIVCITRVYLALFASAKDNGLRCTYNEPKLSHDLGVRLVEDVDGQAVVSAVIPESTAERSGVLIGDKLSFSVPLNSTFQGYERACDFISRLELIGMRTSYRELFEMFLSKTSSGWPIAIVFRRQSEGMLKMKRLPFGVPSMDLNIDLLRATSSLHELITCCREYDHVQESSGVNETVRGNIETFIPRPRCRNPKVRITLQLEPRFFRTPFVPTCSNSSMNIHELLFSREFRRSALLTWYVENSEAMIYMKITNNKGGSGLMVTRTHKGSWSAPCAIYGTLPNGNFQYTDAVDCFIFWKKVEDIQKFHTEKVISIDNEENLSNHLVITKTAGVFYVESKMKCTVQVREDINQLAYCKVKNLDSRKLLEGKIPHPNQAKSFTGALRRLEFPSTMYPHPTPPINLSRFTLNLWERKSSVMSSEILESPFDEKGIISLRAFIRLIERSTKSHIDDKIEMDSFMLNFNRMMFDGVTAERTWVRKKGSKNTLKNHIPSKALLKLWHLADNSWDNATLRFTSRSTSFDHHKSKAWIDFRQPMQKENNSIDCFKVIDIVAISTKMPENIMSSAKISKDEMRKRQKRFVSFEMKDGTKVMFFARTGKDASLLSCGLKLLVERVQKNP